MFDPELERSGDNVEQRCFPCAVPFSARKSALVCPSPVTVHHDCDVLRNRSARKLWRSLPGPVDVHVLDANDKSPLSVLALGIRTSDLVKQAK